MLKNEVILNTFKVLEHKKSSEKLYSRNTFQTLLQSLYVTGKTMLCKMKK